MSRAALAARLVELTSARRAAQPLRVAIDGPDAAGKSTLAAERAAVLAGAIVVSVDGFHRPSGVRRRHGSLTRLYRADADPIAHADVVIDNDDPSRPRVKKWG
jgi:uridine kinase